LLRCQTYGFKNRIGLGGSTGLIVKRYLYWSGYVKKRKFKKRGKKSVTGGLIGITSDRSGQTGSKTDWDEGEKGKKNTHTVACVLS
jgi:hypothetical protein